MSHILDSDSHSKLPATRWQLYTALATGSWQPAIFWESARFRHKFMLRALVMPFTTFKLLGFITAHPFYPQLMAAQPRLPGRLHRPYLAASLGRKGALQAISFHYQRVSERLSNSQFLAHLGAPGLPLATLWGRDESQYTLALASMFTLDREGEMSVILRDARQKMLSEISFTLCREAGKVTLFIGGLQGPNYENAQAEVQQATKACHGLFPKRLVFEAACLVGRYLGVDAIRAVSNRTHVYRSLRYRNRTRHLHSDYDSFWLAMGGVQDSAGHFQLPCQPARKQLEDIASKKRAEYRRRYALLDDMATEIAAQFA